MPYEGRILPIALEEGDRGRGRRRSSPGSCRRTWSTGSPRPRAAVDRLEAAIREQRDASVEEAVDRPGPRSSSTRSPATVEAADEQVKAGEARLDFADTNLRRREALARRDAATDEDLNRAETEQVEAAVSYQQDVLLASAIRSMQAAVSLTPTIIRQYIDRKQLHALVLEREQAEAEARLEQVLLDRQRGTMTSPVDGVVLHREVGNERLLPAGATLLEIGDLGALEVEAEVLTQEAVRVAPGQPVEIYGPAVGGGAGRRPGPPGPRRPGSPRSARWGSSSSGSRCSSPSSPAAWPRLRRAGRLGVGYRVRVRILTDERSRALLVPRARRCSAARRPLAGLRRPRGPGRARRRSRVGLMNDEVVEVRGGPRRGGPRHPRPRGRPGPGHAGPADRRGGRGWTADEIMPTVVDFRHGGGFPTGDRRL